eukprot:gnl/Dysnectes_brevis/6854_a10952_322.p1 GENE.gnl/Dysnectes_brevis/6854_a10952_322~~gnl/Dysnectes_brevis/6854_a10952_322.p1  ORF type:complete len:387 (+),score=60.49 gnl/Dysnectes_brevis/6854_a10952_322:52-1212(+)
MTAWNSSSKPFLSDHHFRDIDDFLFATSNTNSHQVQGPSSTAIDPLQQHNATTEVCPPQTGSPKVSLPLRISSLEESMFRLQAPDLLPLSREIASRLRQQGIYHTINIQEPTRDDIISISRAFQELLTQVEGRDAKLQDDLTTHIRAREAADAQASRAVRAAAIAGQELRGLRRQLEDNTAEYTASLTALEARCEGESKRVAVLTAQLRQRDQQIDQLKGQLRKHMGISRSSTPHQARSPSRDKRAMSPVKRRIATPIKPTWGRSVRTRSPNASRSPSTRHVVDQHMVPSDIDLVNTTCASLTRTSMLLGQRATAMSAVSTSSGDRTRERARLAQERRLLDCDLAALSEQRIRLKEAAERVQHALSRLREAGIPIELEDDLRTLSL